MPWPTTQVNTTHLDAGSDNPANARGDIKQMADNVNDMNNMITMSGVSNEDILQYSSAQGKFIPQAIGSVVPNTTLPRAILTFDGASYPFINISNGQTYGDPDTYDNLPVYNYNIIENSDSIVSVNNGVITFNQTGTYIYYNTNPNVATMNQYWTQYSIDFYFVSKGQVATDVYDEFAYTDTQSRYSWENLYKTKYEIIASEWKGGLGAGINPPTLNALTVDSQYKYLYSRSLFGTSQADVVDNISPPPNYLIIQKVS